MLLLYFRHNAETSTDLAFGMAVEGTEQEQPPGIGTAVRRSGPRSAQLLAGDDLLLGPCPATHDVG